MRLLDVAGFGPEMIAFVNDRPAHDRRYSVNSERLSRLGWSPRTSLDEGLARTFDWYRTHEGWWRPLKQALDRRYEHGFWGGQTCAV
jgi:dTDP-glucose 4,6-dehydratase